MPKPLAETPVLALEGIRKHFDGVRALDGVELQLGAGQVVALIGENGAGKSTAVKIMTGIYRPDAGRILIRGAPVELHRAQDAWRHGIAAVHQETVMFDELSVAENIFAGHLMRNRIGLVDWSGMRRRATEILRSLESDLDPDAPVRTLSVAQKHLVEIARALSHDSQVLIMDEPTAALSAHEIEELFVIIRRLAARGKAILFISHKFDEIFAIADRYTVFRDGSYVGAGQVAEVTQDELVSLMVGRPVTELFPKANVAIGEPVLEVTGLSSADEFDDISFTLHRGEVLGFYGLIGAGRTELMEALFGLLPVTRGEVRLHGEPFSVRSPRGAIDRGMVYVPEDRQRNGAILALSVADNVTLPSLSRLSHLFLDAAAERAMTGQIVERLAVKCAGTGQRVADLSGGNQQKVVIGKWLATRPQILILDEPTKGIDVGSKAAVHGLISELVQDGLSVILVSSELPEIQGVADRVVVMSKGRIVRVLARAELDARDIVTAATGVAPGPEPRA
ncbi:MAG TPA: sugar ABC transporter ATP-binding protein [Kofleriaceae bacterium]|jgi:rhamnose transport system ATP-binding protein|nr:sugar ABC transporter ATP-binding protein [Kofleriaceae bacterium]